MSPDFMEEIRIEMDCIEQTLAHIDALLKKISPGEPDHDQMAAIGAYLTNFYNGIEKILKSFLRAFDVPFETGPNWHVQLLDLFGSHHHPRLPQLIDKDMMIKLDAYRAFRHVFVHGYAFHLRWDRMKPAAEQASVLYSAFRKRVKEIINI